MKTEETFRTLLFVLVLFALSHGCSKEIEEPDSPFIDPEFLPFVEEFLSEAGRRGVTLTADSLTVVFVDEFSLDRDFSNICGYGWADFEDTGKPRVEISRSFNCGFNRRSEIEKENFIFHELGHALLARGHKNLTFDNNAPRSLMCGGFCNNFAVYYDNPEVRSYYLDELFDESTPVPEWVSSDTLLASVFSGEERDHRIVGWRTDRRNDDDNSSQYRFFIEEPGVFPDSSLALVSAAEPVPGSSFSVGTSFSLEENPVCSALQAEATVITNGLHSDAMISFKLRVYGQDLSTIVASSSTVHYNFAAAEMDTIRTAVYCLPEGVTRGLLSIEVTSPETFEVYIDNIEVSLWD